MDPMIAIRQTFFQECEEGLSELETALLRMDAGDADPETVNAVFRAVHSIKGGAGAFDLTALVRFAHVFETTLDDLRAGRLQPQPGVVAVLLRANDVLADLVAAARDGTHADVAAIQAVQDELQAIRGAGEEAASDDDAMDGLVFQPLQVTVADTSHEPGSAAPCSWTIRFAPKAALYARACEPSLLFRELALLGDLRTELDRDAMPALAELDPEASYLVWRLTLEGPADEAAIREVFEFVEDDCELSINRENAAPTGDSADLTALLALAAMPLEAGAPAAQPPPALPAMDTELEGARKNEPGPAPTIRVDLHRVDRLINLVGELVINQAMLSQRISEAGLARASAASVALDELEHLTRDIQDSVMAIRAQPVKSVFQRIPRLVRETAAMVHKRVRLVTEGENTEVDKTVIERLSEPLTHMIRNSIDHGIEPVEARLAAGKPAEGMIRLSALHRSGRIVIEIADDGAGINRARVRQIAIDKGLIAPDAQLSEEETDNLIFLPGFSTAETVSDLSGRGVGMDVVRRSIQSLGGRISILSHPGQGSTFTLSLPLTLAVLDGMVVTVAGQTLVTPLTSMIETLQPKIANVHAMADGQVIKIRDSCLPLVDVGVALGYRSQAKAPTDGVALLVEVEGGARFALLVDAIQGQRQVVIKSLEANFRHVPGIAAATILGDGRVALILDVDAVVACGRGADASPVFGNADSSKSLSKPLVAVG